MVQMASCIEMEKGLDEDRLLEKPRGMRVLTAFEDLYEMLHGFESVGNGLDTEALKEGRFKVHFHRYVNPFSRIVKESPGVHEYKIVIEAENFPARIDSSPVRYPGSWEGVEQDIKDDVNRLKSLGIKNIEYSGYRGDLHA